MKVGGKTEEPRKESEEKRRQEMFVGGTGAVNGECGSHMKPAEKIQGQEYETTQTSQII